MFTFLIFLTVILLTPFVHAQEIGCPMNNQLPSLEVVTTQVDARTSDDLFQISSGENIQFQWSPLGFMGSPEKPVPAALCFVKHYSTLFRLSDPDNELKLSTRWGSGVEKDDRNITHVSFKRVYNDIEVWGSELLFHFNPDGSVYAFGGIYRPSFQGSTTPTITSQQAIEIAQKDYGLPEEPTNVTTNLVFFPLNNTDRLAWEVHYSTRYTPSAVYIIDAENGNILHRDSGIRNVALGIPPNGFGDKLYLLIGTGIVILILAIVAVLFYAKRKKK